MRVFLETRQQLGGPRTARAVRPRLAQMMPSAIKEHAAPAASAPVDAARRAMATLCGCLSVMVVSSHPALADSCPTFNTVSKGEAKGLQWCDVKVGDGDSPVPKAFIKAYVLFFPSILRERLLQITASRAYRRHYTGALDSEMASGVFDSSYDRRKPLGFMVGTHQVISGWDLGTRLENNLASTSLLERSNAHAHSRTALARSFVRSLDRDSRGWRRAAPHESSWDPEACPAAQPGIRGARCRGRDPPKCDAVFRYRVPRGHRQEVKTCLYMQ